MFSGSSGIEVKTSDFGGELAGLGDLAKWGKGLLKDQMKMIAGLDAQLGSQASELYGMQMPALTSVFQGAVADRERFVKDYLPIEQDYLRAVESYNDSGYHEQQSAKAGADQATASDAAYDQYQRQLKSRGIDASKDGGAMANNLQMLLTKNANIADAQTSSYEDYKMAGLGLAGDAAERGERIKNDANRGWAMGTDMGNSMANTQTNVANSRGYLATTPYQGMEATAGMHGMSANIKDMDFQQRMDAAKLKEETSSGGLMGDMAGTILGGIGTAIAGPIGGAIGSAVGGAVGQKQDSSTGVWSAMAADGGHIEAPGTPTSDSGLMRLSDGEFVIPAEVLNNMGAEILNKFVAKQTGVKPSKKQALPIPGGM